ncbi:hypothetical protein M5689_018683 [Euphorbia peplus]|nr:hypothetical protein M5689_018683 [Euphorbia peplus]
MICRMWLWRRARDHHVILSLVFLFYTICIVLKFGPECKAALQEANHLVEERVTLLQEAYREIKGMRSKVVCT